jgi:acetyl esterase/lipase
MACCIAWAAPPADDFVRLPAIGTASISPSSKHLAVTVGTAGGRMRLAVLDLDPLAAPKVIAGFVDADIERAWWVNDDRLAFLFSTRDRSPLRERAEGYYAVNRDGSGQRELIASQFVYSAPVAVRPLGLGWDFKGVVRDGSPDVLVEESLGEGKGSNLARLDTLTGRTRSIVEGAPAKADGWMLGPDRLPSTVSVQKGPRTELWWRREGKAYERIAEFKTFSEEGFVPLGHDDDGALLVSAVRKGANDALYRFDPKTKQFDDDPVVALKDFDLHPSLETDFKGRTLGVHTAADRAVSVWFDDGMRKLQAAVDAALPKRHNKLLCGNCTDDRHIVVHSSSDREPGEYLLLDRRSMTLSPIARTRPWIVEAEQPARSFRRVPARDGLALPVYVTRPANAPADAKLPAVVMVHGGPWVRGHSLAWEPWAAFLGTRGYAVIEVEFRGSTGYGKRLQTAGYKQWGLAMQDDLADAIDWAVRQGLVDPKRVCILGGSYGGYAALMGPIRHPEAYRCAVAFAAVTDIDMMYDIGWSDLSDVWKQHGMPGLIGDQKADAAQFEATSPLKQVKRIKVPLLVAHGGVDRRVPIAHSSRFHDAARDAGVKIDYVVYGDEGHGFYQPKNEADFLKRIEAFLAAHIGPGR